MSVVKPVVGQILYSLNVGNSARGCDQVLTPVRVITVGRKYFTTNKVDSSYERFVKYHIDGWCEKSDYMAESELFVTREEYEELKERQRIAKAIWIQYNYSSDWVKLPLETLREVESLVLVPPSGGRR